jgi:hypothetical protein
VGLWEQQVAEWNARYPLDRWWRQRHGVSFRSPKHLKVSQLAIHFEFEEEKLFNRWEKDAKKRAADREEMEATGIWVNPPVYAETSEAEEKSLFEELGMDDLSQFDDLPDEPAESEEQDVTL